MTNQILVTGATGAIGPILVETLLNHGYKIKAFVRDIEKAKRLLPANVELVIGDIMDPYAIRQAMKDVQYVCHLAAKLHLNNPSPTLEKEYEDINVTGTQYLLDIAIEQNISRFIFFSTISVYGPTQVGSPPFDEQSPYNPQTLYAKTKAAAEKIVLSANNKHGNSITTVLRLATVYGPHMKGNYIRLLNAIQQNKYIPIGHGRNRKTLVFDRDVAQATLHVLNHHQTQCKIYNVTDGQVHTLKEIVSQLYRVSRKKHPSWYIPTYIAKFVALGLKPLLTALGYTANQPLTLIQKLTEDVAIDGTNLSNIGYKPQYNLEKGWNQITSTTSSHPR